MNIKRIIIPLLLILFMVSMVAFGAPVYVNIGPTTELDGDIKILSEIVAEGVTPDGWETTVFFTDPTADNTITIPDYDVTVGSAILLTVIDNENTNENNAILFTSGGVEAGILNIESDGGDFYYNPSDGSLHATLLYGDGTNLTNVGAAAATALTISGKAAENIDKGEVVYISGATGPFAEFSLADNTDAAKHTFCGVAAETKTTGQVILIRVRGELAGFDTSAFADGDVLYLSTAGALTNVKPTSGAIEIIGYVSYDHAAGSIVVMHHSAHGIHVPSTDDIVIRMGDSIAGNKVYFKDYANVEVAFIDSDGKADFTSLTLDTALPLAEGGTGVATGAMVYFTSILNVALYVGRDADNQISWATDDRLIIEIANVIHTFLDIETGAGDNDSLVTQGYVDDAVVGGGANTALSNLAAVAINLSLVSDLQDTDSLGSVTKEWLNLYIGDAGKIYCGLAQDISIHRSGAGVMTLTAANGVVTSAALTVTGNIGIGANDLISTGEVGRDADNFIGFAVDDSLAIEIGGVAHAIVSISDGAANNDKLCTQGYADDAAAGGGANVALSNLAGVAINLSLVSDAADTDDLGSATHEWLNLYLGTYGTVYFGTGQTENIAETAVNELTITATTVVIAGTLSMGANGITTTGTVGRDTDNYLGWGVDNSLAIKINGVAHAIVSITNGVADNDKLATQGYVDDQVAGANVNLSNLAAVAINTTLISDAADTDDLGSVTKEWRSLYIGEAGKIYLRLDQSVNLQATGAGILTITAANGIVISNALTVGGTLALAANSITMTGSIGVTGSRVTKVWATDLEVTNAIAGSITGNARGLVSVANTDITIQPNGTGDTIIYAPADVVTVVNAVHTMTIAEAGTVKVSAAGAAYTITLPTAAGHTGLRYHFIKTDANYTLITLDGHGAETFNYENDTSAPVITYARLNTYCAEITIISDGTNWQVIDEAMGQVPRARAYLDTTQSDMKTTTWTVVSLDTEVHDIGSNFDHSLWVSGAADGTVANHLQDDTNSQFTAAMVGYKVRNTTDLTEATIYAVNDAGDVTISADIFVNGENYEIYNAKFVCPIAGKYTIYAAVGYSGVISDKRYYCAIYNGATGVFTPAYHASSTDNIYTIGVGEASCAVDDELLLKAYNTSGVQTVDIYAVSSTTYIDIRLIEKD